jgi:hypothetical protein
MEVSGPTDVNCQSRSCFDSMSITTIYVMFERECFDDHQVVDLGDFGVITNCDNIYQRHKDKIDQNSEM